MLIKKTILLAKTEVTNNVDANPVAASDAVYVENVSHGPTNQSMVDQTPVKPTLGKGKKLYGSHLWQISFDVRVKGSGAAGTPPECSPLLRACGLGETIVALTSVAYEPVSDGIESATIYVYLDGSLRKLTGCRGNVSFNSESNGSGVFSFSFTGHDAGGSDAALPSPTLDTTEAPRAKSSLFSIGGYAASISNLTFDLANEVATPLDLNSSDGFAEITIIDRDPNGSLNPLNTLKADHDFMADWTSGTEMALTATIGDTAGNKYKIDGPAVSYNDFAYGEREGRQTAEIPIMFNEVNGDDAIKITFL